MRCCSKLILFSAALFLQGCFAERLSVHTEYLSIENLASFHVGTPDPELLCPTVGQRLVVTWALPSGYNCYESLYLDILIRFRSGEEKTITIFLKQRQGTYVYSLLNDEYFEKDGILTYKVNIIGDGDILDEWRHQIWAEKISLNP